MTRFPIVAGAMFALAWMPAYAQAGSAGAVPQEALPELSQQTPAGENLPPELTQLSSFSVAAQQFGNLAATKGTSSLIGDLGDVMVLLHSQINERLHGAGTMAEADQNRLNELSETNEREFAIGLSQWVADSYPQAIEGWKTVQAAGEFGPLATAVLAQLEAQLTVAKKILDAGGNLASPDDQVRQTLSWGGGDEEGGVAQQFQLKPQGDAAAGDNIAD